MSKSISVVSPSPVDSRGYKYLAKDGSEWTFNEMSLGGRLEVNRKLREVYPHPYVEAAEHLNLFSAEERKIVVEGAVSKLQLLGWPLTLDSNAGRQMAMGHMLTLAEIAKQSLLECHPEISADQAFAIVSKFSAFEHLRFMETVFGLDTGDLVREWVDSLDESGNPEDGSEKKSPT